MNRSPPSQGSAITNLWFCESSRVTGLDKGVSCEQTEHAVGKEEPKQKQIIRSAILHLKKFNNLQERFWIIPL